jgi:beta-1,4-mannosyltransferase
MHAMAPDARVVVSPSVSARNNPYLTSVFSRLPAHGFETRAWGESNILAPVEVLHINWPDNFLGRDPGVRGFVRNLRTVAYLRLIRARGTKVVWTAHNLRPHGVEMPIGQWDTRFARLATHFDGVIYLTTASIDIVQSAFPVVSRIPHAIIPHPHYGDVVTPVAPIPRRRLERLVTFGRIEPYKRLPDAYAAIGSRVAITWTVAGECRDAALQAQLAADHPNVFVRYGRLSDQEMEALAAEHDGVLVTQPDFLNSGVLFLGLSLGLPVIAPDTPITREIQAEVGADWLRLYPLPLTPEGLQSCLGAFRGGPPPLDRYAPEAVAAGVAGFYRRLLGG